MKMNEILRTELKRLDEEELREAKQNNGGKRVELTDEQKAVIEADAAEEK